MNPICWLTRRRLDAYHDGELAPEARAKMTAHLARCPGCAAELAALGRLRAALRISAPEPPAAVWEPFWPQVRARLTEASVPERSWRRVLRWGTVGGHPRLAFGSALAAAALAVLAILAPWQDVGERPATTRSVPTASLAPATPAVATVAQQVMVQSVEAADPSSSVMVFSNPDTDVTVVWVFGLQRTGI